MLRKIKRIAPLQCGIVLGAVRNIAHPLITVQFLLFVMAAQSSQPHPTSSPPIFFQQISTMRSRCPYPLSLPTWGQSSLGPASPW